MTKLYLGDEVMNKEQIKKAMDQASRKDPNDKVAEIMTEWYTALGKQGVAIQPKASTILGTILAKHLNESKDVFDQYMNTKASEQAAFWASLSCFGNRISCCWSYHLRRRNGRLNNRRFVHCKRMDSQEKVYVFVWLIQESLSRIHRLKIQMLCSRIL